MNTPLEFTGERFTPECEREIWYEHLHRYAFVSEFCAGQSVLDAACGEGYGTALLATAGARVTGVDLSDAAIQHARQRYGDRPHIEFRTADCTQLPFQDDHFDRIVSFETLEHLEDQEGMLREFRRVLRPDGFLVVSSPDKAEYSDARDFHNEFHVRELYRDELETLLAGQFPAVRLLGQKLLFESAIFSLDGQSRVNRQQWTAPGLETVQGVAQAPLYFIAACAADEHLLPDLQGRLWLFDDADESVYRHYEGEIRRNMAAGGIIADRDREIESLREQLASATAGTRPWWRRLFSKD